LQLYIIYNKTVKKLNQYLFYILTIILSYNNNYTCQFQGPDNASKDIASRNSDSRTFAQRELT